MLREKEASQKAPSQSAVSERSHRTTATNTRQPAATIQVTHNPGSMDGRSARSKLTAAPVGGHSRTGSRVSKRSGLSKEQSRRDDSDDDQLDSQMKSLVMHDNPSRDMVTEIDLTRTPRTSYTAFTTPSVLAHEVSASHFHDEELCILLHAADNPATHDVVRKVLRKGVKDRVGKLGLDHQREVRCNFRRFLFLILTHHSILSVGSCSQASSRRCSSTQGAHHRWLFPSGVLLHLNLCSNGY